MKLLGVLILFAAVIYAQGQVDKNKVLALANECKVESGATDADIQDLAKHAPAANKEAKCLRACMMKKTGTMSADGKVLKDNAIAIAKTVANGDADKESKSIEVINSCAGIKVPADACEAAELYTTCVAKAVKAKGIDLGI